MLMARGEGNGGLDGVKRRHCRTEWLVALCLVMVPACADSTRGTSTGSSSASGLTGTAERLEAIAASELFEFVPGDSRLASSDVTDEECQDSMDGGEPRVTRRFDAEAGGESSAQMLASAAESSGWKLVDTQRNEFVETRVFTRDFGGWLARAEINVPQSAWPGPLPEGGAFEILGYVDGSDSCPY